MGARELRATAPAAALPLTATVVAIIASIAAVLLPANGSARDPQPLRFVDAHSHFVLPNVTPDEELALFRKAGVGAVVLMHADSELLLAVAKRNRGYVIPFISINRLPGTPGLRLGADTADDMRKLLDAGAVCGLGEMPTRLEPKVDPTDAAALLNPYRLKIYALAAERRVPVTIHVELSNPEVIAAFNHVAGDYPRMPLILAHAGWNAGPEVIGQLLAQHRNLYVDLSVRIDPLLGWGNPPAPRPAGPNQLTLLDANGALQPGWLELLKRYPTRFLFAMDVTGTGAGGREQHIGDLVELARTALAPLPRKAQEAIAHGNLEKLVRGCAALRAD